MKTEKRFYLISEEDLTNTEYEGQDVFRYDDEMFQTLAENVGRVYTQKGFVEAFNREEINTAIDQLRIIDVPINEVNPLIVIDKVQVSEVIAELVMRIIMQMKTTHTTESDYKEFKSLIYPDILKIIEISEINE